MLPLKIRIAGFGPHEETEIDFANLRSPIALCASFGTGKTFLMDGILAALFGEFCWYTGSIYDALTQGGTGEGMLELTFTHDSKRYIAERSVKDTGKTRSHRAVLFNGDGAAVAGPKVGDFDRAICALIGTGATAKSTWYFGQNRALDLCGQPGESDLVARRRDVFNELIGAGELDAICERASEKIRELNAVVMDTEAQLAGVGDLATELAKAAGSKAGCETALSANRARLAEAEIELETARTALRDAEGGADALKAQISEHDRAYDAWKEAERRLDRLRIELSSLQTRAAGLEAATEQVVALEAAMCERARLYEQSGVFLRWDYWQRRGGELSGAMGNAARLVETLKAQPGADDATVALAGELGALRDEYQKAKAENDAAAIINGELNDSRVKANNELAALGREKTGIEARLAKKPEVLFADKCLPCPLMEEYAGLDAQLHDITGKISAVRLFQKTIPENTELADLQPLIQRGAEARAAADAVAKAESTRQQLAQAEKEFTAAKRLSEEHEMNEPERADDPALALMMVQKEIDRNAGASDRVHACKQAAGDACKKQEEVSETKQECEEKNAIMVRTAEAGLRARAALSDGEKERAARRAKVEDLTTGTKLIVEQIESCVADIAKFEAQVEEIKRRKAETAEKRERLEAMRERLEGLKDVRQALGPRGARQILIDNAAPELEAIADDLFERATGGRMRLRIATQSVLQDGGTKEDFQILVRDERGERDALRYSGGQLQLIQILFRIAVALWVGQMRGQRPDCLFLDEAFDRLGSDGTEDLLRVLEHLSGMIQMIMVVTHDQDIADRLASRINLRRGVTGVSVEVAA